MGAYVLSGTPRAILNVRGPFNARSGSRVAGSTGGPNPTITSAVTPNAGTMKNQGPKRRPSHTSA
ncbi:hypothetical protein D9R13_11580 [Mycobacteroides abscessus subsp. massiliense]|nr:hypothetical protein D9R13_11580 [Mycobacteroides abscessus subsp. massiliense]